MIDIHAHVLPGVDDGPTSLADAVALCREAARCGTETIIATPHQRHRYWWNGDLDDLRARHQQLVDAVGPEIRILTGGEIRIDPGLLKELDRGKDTELFPLADSRYLLVEFSRAERWPDAENLIHELRLQGWFPVIAHPEVIRWLARDMELLEALVERGGLLQLTAMSVVGGFGRRAADAAEKILSAGLAHFLASDTHDLERRPPDLRPACAHIARRWGDEMVRRLTRTHPACILADQPLPVTFPAAYA